MISRNPFKVDWFLLLSLILLSIFLFFNLGNQYLWQDEAENAVIACNILEYGYPRAFDGSLLVVSDIGYRRNFTWIFQPWLQNYITALSFYLFGKSTFSARLPFAIFGLFSFIASFFLAKRLFSIKVARLSSLILVFLVPYLLMMRSARYYSLALFFSLILIHAYLDYTEKKRFAAFRITFASFFLFNSNFGLFFPLMLGLIIHYLIFHFKGRNIQKDLVLLFTLTLVTLPVFIYFKGWLHCVPLSAGFVIGNIKFYLRSINRYIVPIRLGLVIYAALVMIKRKFVFFPLSYREKRALFLIFFIFLSTILFMGVAKFRSLRYVVYLIPLLVIFESHILTQCIRLNKAFTFICIVFLVTTDLFHHSLAGIVVRPLSEAVVYFDKRYSFKSKFAEKVVKEAKRNIQQSAVKSYIGRFLYEISHDYDGPVECIVKYLKKHADKGDFIKIPYGDYAVAFYTALRVDNKMNDDSTLKADWVIPRSYWSSGFYGSKYYKEVKKRYKRVVLDCPDLRWENRPDDIGYHNFRTVQNYPEKVVLYQKIDDGAFDNSIEISDSPYQ